MGSTAVCGGDCSPHTVGQDANQDKEKWGTWCHTSKTNSWQGRRLWKLTSAAECCCQRPSPPWQPTDMLSCRPCPSVSKCHPSHLQPKGCAATEHLGFGAGPADSATQPSSHHPCPRHLCQPGFLQQQGGAFMAERGGGLHLLNIPAVAAQGKKGVRRGRVQTGP
jgi:hypothetical protein